MRLITSLFAAAFAVSFAFAGEKKDLKPFEYEEANVPFYAPKRAKDGPRGADGWNKMQKPLDAAESMKHLVAPAGFDVQLFTAEPDIAKPIAMTWDHRGRLWVAETLDYPNEMKPRGQGSDRIKICEDTDGDGKADKFTIFAEKLSIPTSLVFANGGLILQHAPDTLFLKDTDGDDKADEIKVLFSGWGTGDTHAGPSNLFYAFDNWVYGMVGYSGFRGTVGGEEIRFSSGFYRFKPDGSKLEFLRSTSNNSWGTGISEEGLIFGSTANGTASVFLSIPNRYYERVKGWSSSVLPRIAETNSIAPITDKVRQVDYHGGFTAAAGHGLYTARTFPREYWNRAAFVNEPTGHLAATFFLERKGTNFVARVAPNLLASDDEWTAPIVSETGPDGQVWVIDWYNFIVQHNPTPHGFKNGRGNAYETPLRDKRHGRIYRVVHSAGKPTQQPKLDANDPASLIAALKSDNLFWRKTAQRMLVERNNTDVVPELWKLVADTSVDELKLNPGAIHALWTLDGLKAIDDTKRDALSAALSHPSAAVRRNAVLVLPRTAAGSHMLLAADALIDADDQVRLAALLTASELPSSEGVANALATVAVDEKVFADRWLPDALTSAAAAQDLAFLKAISAQKIQFADAAAVTASLTRIAEHAVRRDAANANAVLALVTEQSPLFTEAVLAGVANGLPKNAGVKLEGAAAEALKKVLPTASARAKGLLVAIAARVDSTELAQLAGELSSGSKAQALDATLNESERITAAGRWVDIQKKDVEPVTTLLAQITPKTSLELARGFLEAANRSEAQESGAALAEKLGALTPSARTHAIALMLSRADWTVAFVGALEKGKAQLADLSLDQKQSLAAHPNRKIADTAKNLLKSGGGLPDADRQKVIDELAPKVLVKGDHVKGKALYAANCAKCHVHSGEGIHIGPDLTGMAAHPKEELLIHIMDPSRSVEGNFRQYTISTTEGKHIVGLLASETRTSIEVLDAEGKTHAIQRENIKRMAASQLSLMPEGFEKQMSVEDVANLLEFLTHHDKYVPLDLRKSATIVSTKGMFHDEGNGTERIVFADWKPKTFDGVTFQLVDPQGDRVKNAILLHSTNGKTPPQMPKNVTVPCNLAAKSVFILGGVAGWAFNGSPVEPTVSVTVRLHYKGGSSEDHALKNGVHIADYIRKVDVPESKFAFAVRSQQLRVVTLQPKKKDVIERIEFIKGNDATAPLIMAVTVEAAE